MNKLVKALTLLLLMSGFVLGALAKNLELDLAYPQRPKTYSKKISLNFQHIKIRAVLQILADFMGMNLVVSDKVQGSITLRLKEISCDEALDLILSTHGLAKRISNKVLLIDTKINLDKMEKAHLKSQKILRTLEPLHSILVQVHYAKAEDLALIIKDKQNSLLSAQGKISVDARTNKIWIQDKHLKIRQIRRFVEALDVPVQQVLIEARIVQVSKEFSRDLGVKWGLSKPVVEEGEALTFHSADNRPEQKLNLDLMTAAVNFSKSAALGIALAKINDKILLDLELAALENEGLAELISSPRLITVNQQPALIESGQEIPYQEATSSGATAVSFKKAVLSLKVTPQITPDNKILIVLQINQDTMSAHTFNGVPAIFTKEIQTQVLANDGQTIVLGGIYTRDKAKTMNRIPFLGNLPVLGSLFRNKTMSTKNDELLIFITSKIVTKAKTLLEAPKRKVYK